MDIQRTSGVNFGATRVLTVSKEKYITDVYRLNRNDISDVNFIKRCCSTLTKKPDCPKISMKKFFESFLNDRPPSSKNYYVEIKDGETISGGFTAYSRKDSMRAGSIFYNHFNYSQLAKDCLAYSLLSEVQKVSPNTYVVDFQEIGSFLKSYHNDWRIPAEKIAGVKNQIASKYPNHTFDTSNEEVNLERMMGINQLEERILS